MQEHLPPDFARLTRGAFDLHVHGQPDLSRSLANRGDDVAVARLAVDYGMRGWVLKSHVWPTMDRAAAIQREFDPAEFAVFGSITLNPPAGGLSPAAVELAAAHGARMVFLPTWGAAADVARGGYISRLLGDIVGGFGDYAAASAITVLDERGALRPAARSIVAICAERGLTIGTGHVGLRESLAVAELGAELGARVVVNHPLHYVETIADLVPLAALGAFIEFSAAPLMHPDADTTVGEVGAAIAALDPAQVVLTSDAFSRWAPSAPEALRILLEQLAYLGRSAQELHAMTATNPARALGLPAPNGSVRVIT